MIHSSPDAERKIQKIFGPERLKRRIWKTLLWGGVVADLALAKVFPPTNTIETLEYGAMAVSLACRALGIAGHKIFRPVVYAAGTIAAGAVTASDILSNRWDSVPFDAALTLSLLWNWRASSHRDPPQVPFGLP